jgi:hypothetical protein
MKPFAMRRSKWENEHLDSDGRSALPMLDGVADLTLAQLNEATLAWVEMEYNRAEHSELGTTPATVISRPRRAALSEQRRTETGLHR